MKKTLLLGCGHSREKKVYFDNEPEWCGELVTVDMNPECGATHCMTLGGGSLPFRFEEFDEIHAYDCLEHWGVQGDWQAWFNECAEYWRILKPGGLLCCLVPIGAEALTDPGHTRFFHENHFLFLSQDFYRQNEKDRTSFTDYRWFWKRDFKPLVVQNMGGHHLAVMLEKA